MRFFGVKEKFVFEGGGLVLFQTVDEAITAEKILKRSGHESKLVAPPAHLRMGCDLALEINLVEKTGVERLFDEKGARYLEILPLKGHASCWTLSRPDTSTVPAWSRPAI